MSRITATLAALVFTGAAFSAIAQTAPAGRLKGADAMAAVSGNTLSGKIDDEENTIFLSPDGKLSIEIDAERSRGKWAARDGKLCMTIEGEDEECFGLEVEGGAATLSEDSTHSWNLKIMSGNAKSLPI